MENKGPCENESKKLSPKIVWRTLKGRKESIIRGFQVKATKLVKEKRDICTSPVWKLKNIYIILFSPLQ